MKPRYFILPLCISIVSSAAFAADFTWDTASGDSSITGGTGTWDTVTSNWTTDAGVTNVLWDSLTGNTAIFGGTGGDVTVSGAVTASGLTFAGATYVIDGDAITLGGSVFTATANVAATINSELTGGAEFLKLGTGNLTLGAVNTFTGVTRIGSTTTSGGTLTLSVNDAIADSNGLRFGGPDSSAASATLALGSTNQTVKSLQVSFGPSAGQTAVATVTGTGKLTVDGPTDLLVSHNGSGSQPTTSDAVAHLNLSGLSSFEYKGASNKVRVEGGGAANNRAGRLTLGSTSSFTALAFDVHNVTAPSGDARRSDVFLGNTNTINADTINVLTGNSKDSAGIAFRSGLTAGPTLKIRGTGGLDTHRANINIGTTATATNSGTGTGIIDLHTNATASVLDAMVGTLQIGSRSAGGHTHNATFSMALGTLDATTVNLGSITTSTSGAGLNSTFSINGGTAKVSTLNFGSRTAGTLTSTLNLNSGGSLAIASMAASGTATRNLNWNSGTISNYDASTDLSIASGIGIKLAATGTHAFDISTGRTGTVASVISDATTGGTLAKNGAGLLNLTAANTFTGPLAINGGTLQVGGSGTLGSGSYAGDISNSGQLTIGTSAAQVLSGGITGNGSLFKSNTGTLTLSGTNGSNGSVTIDNGIIQVNSSNALGTGTVTIGDTDTSATTHSLRLNGVSIANDVNSRYMWTADYRGTITAIGGAASTINGDVTINPVISGSPGRGGHLATDGAAGSVLRLMGGLNVAGGQNSITHRDGIVEYGGGGNTAFTLLVTGTARLAANDGLSTLATVQLGVSAAATLDLNGHDQTLAGVTKGSFSGTVTNSGTADSTLTLSSSTNREFTGVIQDGATHTVSLVKDGGSTLTLSGNSTYTGETLVSAGTLLVTGQLTSSDVTVEAGATIGGTGTLGGDLTYLSGSSLHVSNINSPLAVTGSVTFGSGFGIDNITGIDWQAIELGTYTLLDNSTDFSLAGLDHFGIGNAYVLGGGRSAYFQNGSLQVVVIPEPRAALLGGLGLLMLLRRRRP